MNDVGKRCNLRTRIPSVIMKPMMSQPFTSKNENGQLRSAFCPILAVCLLYSLLKIKLKKSRKTTMASPVLNNHSRWSSTHVIMPIRRILAPAFRPPVRQSSKRSANQTPVPLLFTRFCMRILPYTTAIHPCSSSGYGTIFEKNSRAICKTKNHCVPLHFRNYSEKKTVSASGINT